MLSETGVFHLELVCHPIRVAFPSQQDADASQLVERSREADHALFKAIEHAHQGEVRGTVRSPLCGALNARAAYRNNVAWHVRGAYPNLTLPDNLIVNGEPLVAWSARPSHASVSRVDRRR